MMKSERTTRNVMIFIIVALLSGWLGYLVDMQTGPQQEAETPGMGLWLVLPLLTVVLLRMFGGDGWRDSGLAPRLRENLRWYFAALLIFPVVTLISVLAGVLAGWTDWSPFRADTYFTVLLSALLPAFIKNIFEEFVWRGYLTAKLLRLKLNDPLIYLIVGGVWGAWHIPYYLFFLPEEAISAVLLAGRITFALIALLTMIVWAVMYVELFRLTRSVWPAVVLHMAEDAVVNHLLLDGHILIAGGKEILVSPIAGVFTSALYLSVGLILRRARIRAERRSVLR